MGLEILSAFVDRLSTRFKSYVAMGKLTCSFKNYGSPDQCVSVGWTLSLKAKDLWFVFWSGHTLALWIQSLAGAHTRSD